MIICRIRRISSLKEMYEYRIDKNQSILKISGIDDDVKLNSITISGKDMPIQEDGMYVFDKSEVPIVSVNYTLFGKHNLTTHHSTKAFVLNFSMKALFFVDAIIKKRDRLNLLDSLVFSIT